MSFASPTRRENILLLAWFIVALAGHFYLTTQNWKSAFMPGHEFRQAQTALVSYYIDHEDNFSLRYETPLFGKPWVALPLEVPFYEWSVVLVKRATHVSYHEAARAVTLACFYLTLPACYLLLGCFHLPSRRRLLILTLLLACPVYIFYSRAFLMESMEVMACAWFLFGFVRMMDTRKPIWLLLATVAGLLGSLIKNTTFAVWLLPAAGYTAWLMWRDFRAKAGVGALARTAAWGLGGVLIPLAALKWWLRFSDAIKEAHVGTSVFTSKNLSTGNFGLLNFASRFSADTWRTLGVRWSEAIMPPWLILLALVAGAAAFSKYRWRIVAVTAVFFGAQLLFPFAYAYQDYYFYACTTFVLAALGFALVGLIESRAPRWLCMLAVVALVGAELRTYWTGYRVGQVIVSNGGSGLTDCLRDITSKKCVIVVAGADWAAMIPYYTQRKALMIRNGLDTDADYLNRAFATLDDEDVEAVLAIGPQRDNQLFLSLARKKFHLDDVPTFKDGTTDVYISRFYRNYVIEFLRNNNPYNVKVRPDDPVEKLINEPMDLTIGVAKSAFHAITPSPYRARFGYGFNQTWVGPERALSAHPDTDIWVTPPANATTIEWDYGLHPTAYEREGDKTNGVYFIVAGERPDGSSREIYRRLLDPVRQPGDRGIQRTKIPYRPLPGEHLVFQTRPHGGYSYDWAYLLKLNVH